MVERVRGIVVLAITALVMGLLIAGAPGAAWDRARSALGHPATPLGTPPVVQRAGAYRFFEHQPGDPDKPVAWDPCEPIHYQVNPRGGPADALDFVADGLGEITRATGLHFQYDGTTDRRPRWRGRLLPFAGHAEPVLVSWADEREVHQLAGNVAGLGGATVVGSGDDRQLAGGGVTLDTDSMRALDAQPNGRALARAILLHELGHLVGLDHVDEPTELMYARNIGQLDFGPGDRYGLSLLGRGRCS